MISLIKASRWILGSLAITISSVGAWAQSNPESIVQACHRNQCLPSGTPCAQAPRVIVHVPEPIVEFVDEHCEKCAKAPCKKKGRDVVATSFQLIPLQASAQQVVVREVAPQPQNHTLNFSVSVPDNSHDIASIIRARDSLAMASLKSKIQRELYTAMSEHADNSLESAFDLHKSNVTTVSNLIAKQANSYASQAAASEKYRAEMAAARLKSMQPAQAPATTEVSSTERATLEGIVTKLDGINKELVSLKGNLATLVTTTREIDQFLSTHQSTKNEYKKNK